MYSCLQTVHLSIGRISHNKPLLPVQYTVAEEFVVECGETTDSETGRQPIVYCLEWQRRKSAKAKKTLTEYFMPTRRTTRIPSVVIVRLLPTVEFVSDCWSSCRRGSLGMLFARSISRVAISARNAPCESALMFRLKILNIRHLWRVSPFQLQWLQMTNFLPHKEWQIFRADTVLYTEYFTHKSG